MLINAQIKKNQKDNKFTFFNIEKKNQLKTDHLHVNSCLGGTSMVAKSIFATRIAGSILQPRTGVVLNSTKSLNVKEL